jgi:hypothetical protein
MHQRPLLRTAAALTALAVAGCGSQDDRKPTTNAAVDPDSPVAKVDRFELRASDLPAGYRREVVYIGCHSRRPAHPTAFETRGSCAGRSAPLPRGYSEANVGTGCTRGKLRVYGASRCESAAFGRRDRGTLGAPAVGLFALRYNGSGAAADGLRRVRDVARSGGYAILGGPQVGTGGEVTHSLAPAKLGDEAPRGVVTDVVSEDRELRDSDPDPSFALYLWRRGRTVVGMTFAGMTAPASAARRIGDFDERAMRRLASLVDARASTR